MELFSRRNHPWSSRVLDCSSSSQTIAEVGSVATLLGCPPSRQFVWTTTSLQLHGAIILTIRFTAELRAREPDTVWSILSLQSHLTDTNITDEAYTEYLIITWQIVEVGGMDYSGLYIFHATSEIFTNCRTDKMCESWMVSRHRGDLEGSCCACSVVLSDCAMYEWN
jgi:hypothetical protein